MTGLPRRRRVPLAALALLLAAAAAVALLAAGHAPARAATRAPAARVPDGFVGVDVDGPMTAAGSGVDLGVQFAQMAHSGVQSIRVAFNWAAAEPYATPAAVPADQRSAFATVHGVPVDFGPTDAIVAAAAARHLSVLPTILYAPPWDAVANPAGVAYPRRPGPYAAFAAALVGRYGPHGSFWSSHPGIHREPIREWQVWNEPNLPYYWHQPFASGYTALLRAAHAAIHRADPGARVMLGSLTDFAWLALDALNRQHGFDRLFDVAAVNAFTERPADVILYLRYVRRALDHGGESHVPLVATELSWPAARGSVHGGYDFDVSAAQAARNVATLLPQLGQQRTSLGLAGFDYYTWLSTDSGTNPFDYSGLLVDRGGRIAPAPALAAFRRGVLRLEGCLSTGPLAGDCRR